MGSREEGQRRVTKLTFSQSVPSHPMLLGGLACYPGLTPTEKGGQGLGPGQRARLSISPPPHRQRPSLHQPPALTSQRLPPLPSISLRTGMPCSWGLSSRLCNSFLEASIFSWSAASTMYLGDSRWEQACSHHRLGGRNSVPTHALRRKHLVGAWSHLLSMGYLGLPPRSAIILSPGNPLWTSCHERGEAWPFKIRCKSLPK